MVDLPLRPARPDDTGALVDVWRRAVEATHDFLTPDDVSEFSWFLAGMLAIFTFAGIGNAGTFKQMPMIFDRRRAGGVIGFTASIAAFGPFLVGMALSVWSPQAFFIGCAVYFTACTVLTWFQYARPGAPKPS